MPRGRKPKSKQYFTLQTEEAINAYNQSTDQFERDRIFSQHIYKPFYKIAEVVYNKYKIAWMGDARDAMMDCLVFMFEKLGMFKGEKGRAFSYFTIIARNYYFQNSTQNFKEMKRELEIDGWGEELDLEEDNSALDNHEFTNDFTSKVIPYLRNNMDEIMFNEISTSVGYLSLEYFYNTENITDYNRKFFQKDIAHKLDLNLEYTDARWKKIITDAHNRLNIYYYHAKKHYLETGQMPVFKKFNTLNAETVKYILDNYHPTGGRNDGALGIAKKINVEETVIRRVTNYPEKYKKDYGII